MRKSQLKNFDFHILVPDPKVDFESEGSECGIRQPHGREKTDLREVSEGQR